MKLKKTVHYYKFRDIMENPLLQEKLLNKKTVAGVLSTISRYSTITRYTITRVDCTSIFFKLLYSNSDDDPTKQQQEKSSA